MYKQYIQKAAIITLAAAVMFNSTYVRQAHRHIYALERNAIGFLSINRLKGYSELKSDNCTVLYTEHDAEFAPVVVRAAELFIPAMAADFGLENVNPRIIIRPDTQHMSTYSDGKGNVPIGAYYGGVINILSPKLWAGGEHAECVDAFLAEGPIVHELTHYMLDTKANGNFDVWFAEGVALYYEYKYTGAVWRVDLEGTLGDATFNEVAKKFDVMEKDEAYRMAFEWVEGITLNYGEVGLQKLISDLATGICFDAAMGSSQQ